MHVNSIKLFKSFENNLLNFVKILSNKVSKFSIHLLQQRCPAVLLVSFFTTNLNKLPYYIQLKLVLYIIAAEIYIITS